MEELLDVLGAGVLGVVFAFAVEFEWDCESTCDDRHLRLDLEVHLRKTNYDLAMRFFPREDRFRPTHSKLRISFAADNIQWHEYLANHERLYKRDDKYYDSETFRAWRNAWKPKSPLSDDFVETVPSVYPDKLFRQANIYYRNPTDNVATPIKPINPIEPILDHIFFQITVVPVLSTHVLTHMHKLKMILSFDIFGAGLDFRSKTN
jgi:hypothetical protein